MCIFAKESGRRDDILSDRPRKTPGIPGAESERLVRRVDETGEESERKTAAERKKRLKKKRNMSIRNGGVG